jgi:hypothetical protein
MEYLIISGTAYISHFYDGIEDLAAALTRDDIGVFEIEGVKKVVWGKEGEDWCLVGELMSKVLT